MSEDSKQTVVPSQQAQQVQQQQLDPEMKSIQEFIGRNAGTMVKLSVFSAALFAFPILTFFCTLHSLFDGNTTYAAGAAAGMANLIVILYIIVAFFEKPNDEKKKEEEKKSQ